MLSKGLFRHILLWGILFSGNALAEPKVQISDKTKKLLSQVGWCDNANVLQKPVEHFQGCFLNSVEESKFENFCIKSSIPLLLTFGCKEQFIYDFYVSFMTDNVKIHKFRMKEIKDDIASMRAKGLPAGFLINKYINYEKMTGVKDQLAPDADIVKLKADKLASMNSRKATCTDIITLKPPLSLEDPSNQDTIGWCYAYTAADMLTQALGKKVSPIKAAALWNDKLIARAFLPGKEGGMVVSTLEESISQGICLEKNLPSTDYRFSKEGYDFNDLYRQVQTLSKKYSPERARVMLDKKQVTPKKVYSKKEVMTDLCINNKNALEGLVEIFPQLNVGQIADIMMTSGLESFEKMVSTCPLEQDPELKNLVPKKETNNDKIFPTIDDQLNKGNIVGMLYRSEVLFGYDKSAVFPNHVSTIVGRRFNEQSNSCEYLIRNIWGKTCSPYSEDYECKNGHVWIPEDALKYKNTIHEVQYIEKK